MPTMLSCFSETWGATCPYRSSDTGGITTFFPKTDNLARLHFGEVFSLSGLMPKTRNTNSSVLTLQPTRHGDRHLVGCCLKNSIQMINMFLLPCGSCLPTLSMNSIAKF